MADGPGNPVSPKVQAAGVGAAIATIFWVVAAATFCKGTFSDTALSALTGSSSTVLAFILGYIVRDPLRQMA